MAPEPVAPFAFLKRPQMRHSGRRSQGQVCPQFLEWVNFIRLLLFVSRSGFVLLEFFLPATLLLGCTSRFGLLEFFLSGTLPLGCCSGC